jgi:hypothetical protein
MKQTILIVILLTLTMVAAQCGSATPVAPEDHTGIEVMMPYARSSIPNGAVYMHLMNHEDTADALISAESDVAESVEIHETTIDENDVMKMQQIEKVEIPAGGEAVLEPGGKHIMLIGLRGDLMKGDKINLTLHFEKAPPMPLEVEVKESMSHGGEMEHNTK